MIWDDDELWWASGQESSDDNSDVGFDFVSILLKTKDYYKVLEVDYDASEEVIRSNYIRLALKWHPDKQKNTVGATSKFQDINEAYRVLSDPVKRYQYDKNGVLYSRDSNFLDYLNRYKSLILTPNGLGMKCWMW